MKLKNMPHIHDQINNYIMHTKRNISCGDNGFLKLQPHNSYFYNDGTTTEKQHYINNQKPSASHDHTPYPEPNSKADHVTNNHFCKKEPCDDPSELVSPPSAQSSRETGVDGSTIGSYSIFGDIDANVMNGHHLQNDIMHRFLFQAPKINAISQQQQMLANPFGLKAADGGAEGPSLPITPSIQQLLAAAAASSIGLPNPAGPANVKIFPPVDNYVHDYSLSPPKNITSRFEPAPTQSTTATTTNETYDSGVCRDKADHDGGREKNGSPPDVEYQPIPTIPPTTSPYAGSGGAATSPTADSLPTNASCISCDICGKRFKSTLTLAVHGKNHKSGARPYPCQYCGKGFMQQTHLKQHERCHTKERPYTCNFCPKTFTQKSGVVQHERIHTGEKPYVCKHCPKAYRQMSGLKQHLGKHVKDGIDGVEIHSYDASSLQSVVSPSSQPKSQKITSARARSNPKKASKALKKSSVTNREIGESQAVLDDEIGNQQQETCTSYTIQQPTSKHDYFQSLPQYTSSLTPNLASSINLSNKFELDPSDIPRDGNYGMFKSSPLARQELQNCADQNNPYCDSYNEPSRNQPLSCHQEEEPEFMLLTNGSFPPFDHGNNALLYRNMMRSLSSEYQQYAAAIGGEKLFGMNHSLQPYEQHSSHHQS